MAKSKANAGASNAVRRKASTTSRAPRHTEPTRREGPRIPLTDLKTARGMRAFFESQIRPVTLLRRYVQLREGLAQHGPNEDHEKTRTQLVIALMVYRTQLDYDRMKAKHGAISEDLEYAFRRPLTETDRERLKAIWAIEKEVRELLGIPRRKRKQRAM